MPGYFIEDICHEDQYRIQRKIKNEMRAQRDDQECGITYGCEVSRVNETADRKDLAIFR